MTELYKSNTLDHLGLVSGMYDELGIGEVIDKTIKQDREKRIVSVGQAVKAMVLNGLGFVNKCLYLVPMFFADKPVERLIGRGICASHLNDDTLGRALDEIHEFGETELFSLIGMESTDRLSLKTRFAHLDSTSLHVDGRYNSDDAAQEGVIHITKGYSRDHRPELNQVVLDLIVENKAGIPFLMQPMSGNSNDKRTFVDVIGNHIDMLQNYHGVEYFVADSALYSEENLKRMDGYATKWISRVPETIKEVKEAIEQTEIKSMVSIDEHYSFSVTESTYGDVKQRWLIVFSKHAYEREMKTANKMVLNGSEREMQEFKKLCQKEFACIPDAEKALSGYEKGLKHTIVENGCIKGFAKYKKVGRPKKETEPDKIVYQIEGTIATSLSKRKLLINRKGFFVLATNELDENLLSHIEVFENYKNQSFVERGFRFLKDPMFLASSLYLKSPERIMALLMVMTVCLLVYAALEYKIRKGLKEQNKAFPNQKGVPIQNPTSRWIFQCFVGIHLLIIQDMQEIILNLNDLHRLILYILGDNYASFYT